MNTSSPDRPSLWQRTTTRRLLIWLLSWRTVRRLLISLAILITIYAVYRTEEDIRAKHAWEKYRRDLEARGERLDLRAFIPKPVPDDQNFASIPLIQSWFVRSNTFNSTFWQKDNYGQVSDLISSSRYKKDGGHRHFTDLVAWGMAFDALRSGKFSRSQRFESGPLDRESRAKAVPAVLDGLKTNEAIFAELRAASDRPYSRYPINYDVPDPAEILLPHLTRVRAVCRRLGLRACAELATGRSEDALEDVKLILYMDDSIRYEPTLISYLVQIACLDQALQPVWEGLAEHRWSDGQLQEVQARLQQYDFVADLKHAFDAERTWGIGIIEFIKNRGKLSELIEIAGSPQTNLVNLISRVVPSGWYYQEELSYCRLFEIQLNGSFDVPQKRISPARVAANASEFDRTLFGTGRFNMIFTHHRLMASMLLPALDKVPRRGAAAQTGADQAALACALERYRLANGRFPDTLDALVPQFISQLPHDVITGEPYKYRRTDDGQFVLYSVGWNEKDDGGVPGKILFDAEQGDWVW